MSTIGATKAQITKTVNTLRKALEEAERQLAPAPDGRRASTDELEDRWEGEHALAEGQASPEEEASVLGDLQSHWDANACDQLMADAERLLARVKAAQDRSTPSAPSSALHRVNTAGDTVNPTYRESGLPAPTGPIQYHYMNGEFPPFSATPLGLPSPLRQDGAAQGQAPPTAMYQAPPLSQRQADQYSCNPNQYIKLPPFELPEFSGEMHSFPEFWELFTAAVHNNNSVRAITKFLYLRGKLKGDALKLISALQLTEVNYSEAIKILTNTYLRPEPLRNKLQRQLEAVPPAHRSPLSQRTTLCTLKSLWVQLERLGEHPASTTHMSTIRTKFPNNTRDKVGEMRSTGDNWDVNTLLSALDKVIDRLEVMEDNDPERFTHNTTQLTLPRQDGASTLAVPPIQPNQAKAFAKQKEGITMPLLRSWQTRTRAVH
ncbi:unnamed protein product [Heligmosomoides polygyrus]|uniref:Gag_p30 domain-containing protein n=1 Tax=Heligmosomoides polygyrus TaxID=6339 RepID=A0A183GQX8_HELPZ|nr:unnamed protein product [Heligmosomoides polygyrus]